MKLSDVEVVLIWTSCSFSDNFPSPPPPPPPPPPEHMGFGDNKPIIPGDNFGAVCGMV